MKRYDARRRGFTMIEVIVGMVVGSIVIGSVVQVMIVQGKSYRKQREILDIRETARQAAALLAWDLRQSTVGGAPLAAIAGNSVTLRSPRAIGMVCNKHATLPRYGLWKTGGNFLATADDTAVVYAVGRDVWKTLKITAVGTPAAMGVTTCAWAGARAPDIVVEFAVNTKTDTSWIKVGAPFRSFRRVQYAEYQANNRWWLGRKIGNSPSFEQLTGPLRPPGNNGLSFTYYDTLGAVTANPAALGSVAFTLRTESFKSTYVDQTFDYQRDSLTTRVAVRR
jgi:prepilin-type N-terminal cleavage/methylation domain-containing protein